MREPLPSEEYVTIIDNKGREKVQRVEYVVRDVRGEKVYVTADGLAYTEDSLEAKEQNYLIEELDRLAGILVHPDVVIWALKLHMAGELFDVPQANLKAVPLHKAFSWAYAHFILEDSLPAFPPEKPSEPRRLTRQVLSYAAAAA